MPSQMTSTTVIAVLTYAHVLSAMGWLGGGMLTTFFIGPNLAKLAPAARLEFNAKVLPKVVGFVQMMIVSTLLFGVLLYYSVMDGLTTTQGYEIYAGIAGALIVAAVAFSLTLPSFRKVITLSKKTLEGGQGPPPPEMMTYGKRARTGSIIGVVILLFSLAMMVASGFS